MSENKKVELIWNPPGKIKPFEQEKPKPVIRVAAYCRTSTKDDEMLKSLENQIQHYTRYIESKKDYKLIGIYFDKGISGANKDKRPGFMRMLRHCEEGRIDLILTKSVSRFSRNSKDLLEVVQRLKELGINVRFEKENINTLEMQNEFYLTTLAAIAQEELRTLSELSSWGFEKRFMKGIPCYKPQYGYHVIENKRDPIVTINEKEAEVVKEIFELYIGGMQKRTIARHLIDKGVKTASGSELWNGQKIDKILRRRSYTGDKLTNAEVSDYFKGVYTKNDGVKKQYLIENSHPAIINRETFQRVQELLEQERAKHKIDHRPPRLLPMSKRIICGFCDTTHHHLYRSWICKRRKESQKLCQSEKVSEKDLLKIMKNAFKYRYDFENPNVLKRMLTDLKRMNKNDHFEYRRLVYFSKLEMAKEEELKADEITIVSRVAEVEEELLQFEEWAEKIEQDRSYRDQTIEWLDRITSIEQFYAEMTIEYIRAWIMSITIFSPDAYIIQWFDQEETKIGESLFPEKPLVNNEVTPTKKESSNLPKIKRKEGLNMQAKVKNQNVITDEKQLMILSKNAKKEYEHYTSKFEVPSRKELNKSKIRTAAYARISTDIPHQLGSLEAQIAYYTYYILKDPKQSLVKVYADRAVSGTSVTNRTEFLKMMEDAKAGKIDRIITKSISRFGRNTVDVIEHVRMLKNLSKPVEVVFQREGIRTLNEDSEVMLTVYSSLAQEESRSLSESVAWGRRKLAERGAITNRYSRYGYDYDEYGEMVFNSEEADIVQRMYNDLLNGKSTNRMAKELSEEGVVTPRGNKRWDNRTIDCIITNPIYSGDYIFQRFIQQEGTVKKTVENKGELPKYLIEDHHPAIVSKEVWGKAQQIMNNRGGIKGRKLKPHDRQEFFDVFHCPECEGPVTHIRSSRNGAHYWRCKAAATRRTETTCTVRGFREESIEHTFMAMLQEMKFDENFETKIKQAVNGLKPSEDELKNIEEVKEKMQLLYHELYNTVDEGDKHGGDPKEIKQITDQIVAQQNQIYDFEGREQQATQLQKDLDWFLKELEDIQSFKPEKETIEFRADIFSKVVEKGMVFPDGRIVYDLKFGIQCTVSGVEKMAWKLRKKGKPRKKKKK